MATQKIAFPVVFRQNQNISSKSYGKFFVEARSSEPLLLEGLMNMCAWDQSVYTPDIVQGVIDALGTVMLELMREGQPVKWDKLGTFAPWCQTEKGGVTKEEMVSSDFKVTDVIKGVHIRFLPENAQGEEITSRKFKDLCKFDVQGIVKSVPYPDDPTKRYTQFTSLEEWKAKRQ